ncbi:putative tellurite resistance protein B-like protein [Alteromonadaceae bacterium 2753L.S.0a.02]|nr:putative tellurite resistance protein B-like protein [Alteromonadaceae bacterium 2753L.S.0a.02]
MLNAIKEFFCNELQGADENHSEQQRRLACAALLLEVAVIDQEFDPVEMTTLRQVLGEKFAITETECDTLIKLAESECEDATSTYQFTQLVNEFCNENEKYELIKGMWSIAYADGTLDKYEEYVIRKVAELIYVSHSQFIHAKHAARPE